MVFRLPSQLNSLVPPPSAQSPHSHSWRGTLFVSGMRPSDIVSSQELRVSAVESDGDRIELWPTDFYVYLTHDRPILKDVQAWAQHHSPPLSTFLPDRLRHPDKHLVNQTTFRSLSRLLRERQIVGIAPWNRDDAQRGGVVFLPTDTTDTLLIGFLFIGTPIPDFILGGFPTSHSLQHLPPLHHTRSSYSYPHPQQPYPQPGPSTLPAISSSLRPHSHSPTSGPPAPTSPAGDEQDLATFSPISDRFRQAYK